MGKISAKIKAQRDLRDGTLRELIILDDILREKVKELTEELAVVNRMIAKYPRSMRLEMIIALRQEKGRKKR